MEKSSRIFVAGGQTLIGAAILRELKRQDYSNVVIDSEEGFSLNCADDITAFFARHKPEYVFHAAGRSGGIYANQKYPAELMIDNLLVNCRIIDSAWKHGVKKLLFLASSCAYPKYASQPMRVEALMTGELEPTNEAYAVAKIAGLKLCQAYRSQYGADFITGIPANAFGPGDDFDPQEGHVIPALIYRLHQAKVNGSPQVEIWGTGNVQREFIHADDLADACLFVMNHYSAAKPINLGTGEAVSIRGLAFMIKEIVGYYGELYFDTSKPDGFPFKSLDSNPLNNLGWQAVTSLEDGVRKTYEWYISQHKQME